MERTQPLRAGREVDTPIPSVRTHMRRNQAGTLGVPWLWLGPSGAARVVTRGPGGDGVAAGGMTPFVIKEFPGSLAPRCHEQTPRVLITHTKVVLT